MEACLSFAKSSSLDGISQMHAEQLHTQAFWQK